MSRRQLLGIGCALAVVALALGPAVSPARAQFLGLPPVIVLPPPPVIVLPPPPVVAPSLIADKIDPALLALMAADPQRLLPVIVEMQEPLPPFIGAPNVDRALEALDLLRFNGVAVAPLSLIDSAAGFANAAGIDALSLVPTVAFVHHDATVGPQPSAAPPVPPATADQVSGVYPRVVKANKVWAQGITGGGVTVAILDSGVAADADLVQPNNRLLASVNFADERLTIDPYVITVGATDDRGTLGRGDDLLAWFSAWGSPDSNAKPDLVAPGRRIVSLRVPGSALDTLFPERVVVAQNGATYFRLTGTSMATAVVSGAAALLLQGRPNLTPDQVKALLVGTTQRYGQESGQILPDPIADGSGLLDANAASLALPCDAAPSSGGALLGGLLGCDPAQPTRVDPPDRG